MIYSQKFGRFYEMVFNIGYLEKFGDISKPVIEYTTSIKYPLTLDLNISRGIDSKVNTGLFTIFGLSEKTRTILHKDRFDVNRYINVQLWAGYEQEGSSLVFDGTIKECYSHKPSGATEYRTVIDAYDGGLALYLGETNSSFTEQSTGQTLLETITRKMPDVDLGTISPYVDINGSSRGYTAIGKPDDELKQITNGNSFVDNGILHVMDRDLDVLQGSVTVLNVDKIFGSPRRFDTKLRIEILFEHALLVGQLIELKSSTLKYLNGRYKVLGFNHEGRISGSFNGELKTTLDLFIGTGLFRMVGGI